MSTNCNAIAAFVESELRAGAQLAQRAFSALTSDKPSEARQHVVKARLCFMAALSHRHEDTRNERASPDADRLDDAVREIERLIEAARPIDLVHIRD
jgi:tRNA U34 5-carboxymethylaminomethyl modifying GTPase MnmE/TrmE